MDSVHVEWSFWILLLSAPRLQFVGCLVGPTFCEEKKLMKKKKKKNDEKRKKNCYANWTDFACD